MNSYMGMTHFVPFRLLYLWKRFFCKRNIHAFDEVESLEGHYLVCDACQLIVNIKSVDTTYQEPFHIHVIYKEYR